MAWSVDVRAGAAAPISSSRYADLSQVLVRARRRTPAGASGHRRVARRHEDHHSLPRAGQEDAVGVQEVALAIGLVDARPGRRRETNGSPTIAVVGEGRRPR